MSARGSGALRGRTGNGTHRRQFFKHRLHDLPAELRVVAADNRRQRSERRLPKRTVRLAQECAELRDSRVEHGPSSERRPELHVEFRSGQRSESLHRCDARDLVPQPIEEDRKHRGQLFCTGIAEVTEREAHACDCAFLDLLVLVLREQPRLRARHEWRDVRLKVEHRCGRVGAHNADDLAAHTKRLASNLVVPIVHKSDQLRTAPGGGARSAAWWGSSALRWVGGSRGGSPRDVPRDGVCVRMRREGSGDPGRSGGAGEWRRWDERAVRGSGSGSAAGVGEEWTREG